MRQGTCVANLTHLIRQYEVEEYRTTKRELEFLFCGNSTYDNVEQMYKESMMQQGITEEEFSSMDVIHQTLLKDNVLLELVHQEADLHRRRYHNKLDLLRFVFIVEDYLGAMVVADNNGNQSDSHLLIWRQEHIVPENSQSLILSYSHMRQTYELHMALLQTYAFQYHMDDVLSLYESKQNVYETHIQVLRSSVAYNIGQLCVNPVYDSEHVPGCIGYSDNNSGQWARLSNFRYRSNVTQHLDQCSVFSGDLKQEDAAKALLERSDQMRKQYGGSG